jgi:hypothetical protein
MTFFYVRADRAFRFIEPLLLLKMSAGSYRPPLVGIQCLSRMGIRRKYTTCERRALMLRLKSVNGQQVGWIRYRHGFAADLGC